MIKWKIKFFIFIFIYYSKFINCENDSEKQNDVKNEGNYYNYSIELGKNQIKYLKYMKKNQFTFIKELKRKDFFVNFHSIDCNINISSINKDSKENVHITEIKKNIFSISINSNEINNTQLLVEPFIYSGNNDKYINYRNCPVIINSYYKIEPHIDINEEEPMALIFNENLSTIEFSYTIKNLTENSFIILSFISDENFIFNVDIKNISNRTISNSFNIFLYYNELSEIENDSLTFNITYFQKNVSEQKYNSLLIFKLIESNSISILEKNKLNFGFTISKEVNQYYYLEVYKGEEGEVILHNKRLYGELYGNIKSKSGINPYNRKEYIKDDKNNQLKFDANTRKLSFKLNQTKQCEDGCYLFITYYHDNYDFSSRVGFEYTLLARIWDKDEIGSQIINIPFNEYIFGVFEENSINHHYYSLFIPKNTTSIIIQFEGNYVEGFKEMGKKKLNTFRDLDNSKKINNGENKKIQKFDLNETNTNDYMSFAFRLQNFFEKEFSFYYFRILLLKKNEKNTIYPLDSNIGNLCLPEKEGNDYFCNCLLKNYYNEFSLDYSISASNEKEKLAYNYFKLINGSIAGHNLANITSASIKKYNNYESLIKFKYENNTKIVNILSTLSNNKTKIYPQIYSTQMYYFNEYKEFIFNLNNSFTLILNYILGQGKIICPNFNLTPNVNFKGKPFLINLNNETKHLKFLLNETETEETKELIFYIKFQQNNEIKEITQGETLREFVNAKRFPIYYYIKNGENKINYMNIHFIIKNMNDKNKTTSFEINGYLMNETVFSNKKKINGEFINLKEPIRGSYDTCFRNGILNINKEINGSDYILIEIDSSSLLEDDEIIMDILTMSKQDDIYILPINNYLTDIYNSSENRRYKILIDEEDLNKEILVEFIPDSSKLIINNDTTSNSMRIDPNYTGNVQRYRISGFRDDFFLNIKAPQDISYGNYIIKYYFTDQNKEQYYKLNKTFTKIKVNKTNDIILKFNELEITNNNNNTIERKILFKINGFLYTDENDIKNELFNSSEIPPKNIFKNYTFFENNTNFSLYFSNVKSRSKNNYTFYLRMNIVIYKIGNMFNEDFFVYTLPVNLEKELKEKLLNYPFNLTLIIIIGSLVLAIIIIILGFTIGFIKIKKKNTNLKEKVLAISFTSEKFEEETNERRTTKKDEDYENTFI